VRGLTSEFLVDHGVVRAVDGVSFDIQRGEILGVVGESGCGKSVTALSILRLLPRPRGRITHGSIELDGKDLTRLSDREMRRIRGNRVAMIFQDPMTSLNPYLTVGEQLAEVCELHLGLKHKECWQRSVDLLERVRIPDPGKRAQQYPHELSGGMRQRAMIAMALLCEPELLIADEPTTALDVTIQAQVLELLQELCAERHLSVMLITHDMRVVASTCQRVMVMYAGRVVETAPTRELFESQHHPYTRALLRSMPRAERSERGPLFTLQGLPPQLGPGGFDGCSFAARCSYVRAQCKQREPELAATSPARAARCILPPEELT
jgi:peptide/nickel transport system ATP-binding protein/oligopeptide transport system ATP-binding protein